MLTDESRTERVAWKSLSYSFWGAIAPYWDGVGLAAWVCMCFSGAGWEMYVHITGCVGVDVHGCHSLSHSEGELGKFNSINTLGGCCCLTWDNVFNKQIHRSAPLQGRRALAFGAEADLAVVARPEEARNVGWSHLEVLGGTRVSCPWAKPASPCQMEAKLNHSKATTPSLQTPAPGRERWVEGANLPGWRVAI